MAWTGRISLAKDLKIINLHSQLVLAFVAQLVMRRVTVSGVRSSILVLGNIFSFVLVLLFFCCFFLYFSKNMLSFLDRLKIYR